jgi:hypothetical protein
MLIDRQCKHLKQASPRRWTLRYLAAEGVEGVEGVEVRYRA